MTPQKTWGEYIIAALPFVVALAGIGLAAWQLKRTLESQERMKKFEVTFLAKQQAYSALLTSIIRINLRAAFPHGSDFSFEEFKRDLFEVEGNFQNVEPFLSGEGRIWLKGVWKEYHQYCSKILGEPDRGKKLAYFVPFRDWADDEVRVHLFRELFEK